MPRLEAAANVVLRVPALALLDLLYRWDAAAVAELLRPRHGDGIRGDALLRPRALRGASCVGEGERGRRAWGAGGRPGVWGGAGPKAGTGRGGGDSVGVPGLLCALPGMGTDHGLDAFGPFCGPPRLGTPRGLPRLGTHWGHPRAWPWWGRSGAALRPAQAGDTPRTGYPGDNVGTAQGLNRLGYPKA